MAELRSERFTALIEVLRAAASALREAGIPFALGGSLACWAQGGPASDNDLDLIVMPDDAKAAQAVLVESGMRAEDPPEEWLLKAWSGPILVDLIFRLVDRPVDEEVIARSPELKVAAVTMRVMRLEDVLTTKLKALGEHDLDLGPLVQIARSVREKVDWEEVRAATGGSPYARVFMVLLEELEVVPVHA
jgi:predicted nucleotidyltransferase